MSCRWGACALAVSLGASCGPAERQTEGPVARLRQPLSGGQIEPGYSGALALITVTRERVELCTATLLTPNLVATARHCVAATSADTVRCAEDPAAFAAPHDTDSLWVHREEELRGSLASYGLLPVTGGGDELLPVAEVFVPDTPQVCGGDLALLLLGEQLPSSEAEPIAPRLDAPVIDGEPYTAIGFGATPAASEQGARRSREGLLVSCTPESCTGVAGVESNEFRGGDGVCSGDSGGPAIDAEGRVIGIASRSVDCTESVYSALPLWRDFIREVTGVAVRAGDYPEPEWLEPAPPMQPEPEMPDASGADSPPEPSLPEPEQAAASDSVTREASASDSAPQTTSSRPTSASGADAGCSLPARPALHPPAAHLWPFALLLGAALGLRARRAGARRGP